MAGIKIIDVKIVGMCSKHRIVGEEILRDKNGKEYEDKDIACVGCSLGGEKEFNLKEKVEQLEKELSNYGKLPKAKVDGIILLVKSINSGFIKELKERLKQRHLDNSNCRDIDEDWLPISEVMDIIDGIVGEDAKGGNRE